MKVGFIVLLLLSGCFLAPAQSLNKGITEHPDYVYRITSEEAHYIWKHGLKHVDTLLFRDLAGIYPDFKETSGLSAGHYLVTKVVDNQLVCRYTPITPWHIYIQNDVGDYIVQLTDKSNHKPFESVIVKVGNTTIPYDKGTSCYRLSRLKKTGTLTVSYGGQTFYYSVSKVYGSPMSLRLIHMAGKYIVRPASFLAKIPIDGYTSIKKGRPLGTIRKIKFAASKAGQWFKSDKHKNKALESWTIRRDFKSYFLFSKPIYKERDTIKFKAYILEAKKNNWLSEELWITLDGGTSGYYYLGKVKPQQKGDGYSFQFVIDDSMDIELDDDYEIELKTKDSLTIAWGKFQYENYELKRSVFKMELPKDCLENSWSKKYNHTRNKPFVLKLTARDDNGLPMPDAKAEFYIVATKASAIKADSLFVPDTLWHYSLLVTDGEKLVTLPDSIFPAANVDYKLYSILRNSENEREESSYSINFSNEMPGIAITLEGDAISFKSPNATGGKLARIYTTDKLNLRLTDTLVHLPYTTRINTNAEHYYCDTDDDYEKLDMASHDSEVSLMLDRTTDSIFIDLINPRKLSVIYQLYKNEKEIDRGNGQMPSIRIAAAEQDRYYIAVKYIWAGKAEKQIQAIVLAKTSIRLQVIQPPVIYPGKEVDVRIKATNYRGEPVSGMNILAYSFTTKFLPYEEPALPYLGKDYKSKRSFERFELEDDEGDLEKADLNFPYWNKILQLDTSWYYRFLFPQKSKIGYFSFLQDDSITQIAPYIVDSGVIQPVYYVLIDDVPVYFNFTNYRVPYSFETDTASHTIKVRTPGYLVAINNVRATQFHKTLISADPAKRCNDVTIEHYPDTLSSEEQTFLSHFILALNSEQNSLKSAYLSNAGSRSAFPLLIDYRYQSDKEFKTIGPLSGRYNKFTAFNNFSIDLEFEPLYQYYFRSGNVKMKSVVPAQLFPDKLPRQSPPLADKVLTETWLVNKYQATVNRDRMAKALHNFLDTIHGPARLSIALSGHLAHVSPLNILLFRPDDFNFIKIYQGEARNFTCLPPGKYQLLVVGDSNVYLTTSILTVKTGGENFYRFRSLDTLKGKSVTRINTLLNQAYQQKEDSTTVTRIMGAYLESSYKGPSQTVKGKVLDDNGEAVIGATIIISQTTIGTVSDADGNFEINMPLVLKSRSIIVRCPGHISKTVPVTTSSVVNIVLQEDATDIGEVRIYGQKLDKKSFTGSVSTITSKDISRRPITDLTRALQGNAPGVAVTTSSIDGSLQIVIRGQNTFRADSTVLIVIDGAIYNGGLASLDPGIIASITLLKDASATSIYGSRGANGVVLITLEKGVQLPDNIRKGLETLPMSGELMTSGLRNNFRDDAYWHPDLRTDANGEAAFKVKFPDDITAWKTFVYATDDKRHTGQTSGLIKSYKPVSASLHMPAFLIQGDTAQLLGKSVNYLPGTQPVTTAYYKDSVLIGEKQVDLDKYHNDTLQLVAGNTDSIRLKYLLRKEDGYFDGEEKPMPVLPKGVMVALGTFLPLDMTDTVFTLPPFDADDTLHLSATASLLDIIDEEIKIVSAYEHLCNEQLASKIIAALNQERIARLLQRSFDDRKLVQEMIDKLLQRQNGNRLWGWWENGNTVPWISNHVVHALLEAREMKYATGNLNFEIILQPISYQWQTDTAYADIQTLQLLLRAGISANYEQYISRLERKKHLPFSRRLSLIRMRQQAGLHYSSAALLSGQKQDIFGNIYWKDSLNTIYENEVLTTLTAFKIVQTDSTIPINKNKILNWLLQQRNARGWRNIYESSQIIEAIAQNIPLSNTDALIKPRLSISGGYKEEVGRFPYRRQICTTAPITIKKQGNYPVYFTWYRQYWDTTNQNLGKNFILHSSFEGNEKEVAQLNAGNPVTMKVKVTVEKSAEFVMIAIPIPAGCTYREKKQSYSGYETHREYRKDKVSIFCEQLPAGVHTYTIELLPRYSGNYTLNPAKAELMYFPLFYGRSAIKRVDIR